MEIRFDDGGNRLHFDSGPTVLSNSTTMLTSKLCRDRERTRLHQVASSLAGVALQNDGFEQRPWAVPLLEECGDTGLAGALIGIEQAAREKMPELYSFR